MKEKIFRYLMFILGIGINSFGIALITKGALGTSQISSIPYVLSLKYSKISFGTWTFLLNILFIIMQVILLKKEFHPVQYLQIFANIIFSCLIDVSMYLLKPLPPGSLYMQFICLLAGCFILAFGIAVEVAPDVITVPGEGIVRALSLVTNKKFGSIKMIFDITLIIIAVILSFLFFGKLQGIGIGTLVSAITVGRFVNIINKHIDLKIFCTLSLKN